MTAPRAREQADSPSSPDRRPPRRGGGSSPRTYAASAAGRARGRGLVRSVRALAAAALLALTGALFLPATAEAQTATTLVSNTGQSSHENYTRRAYSQRFTTGSNEDGYTLTGVDVVSASSTGFTAQVCGVDSGTLFPTSTCTELTRPDTFAVGTMSFTAPADIPLTNYTTYAVVVTALATNTDTAPGEDWEGTAQGWGVTFTDDEDADPAAGWSLSDSVHSVDRRQTLGSWFRDGAELRIAIKGYAGGGTLSTDATLSALSLGSGVTLSPTFASGTATYTALVANSVDEVTVTATKNHPSADVEIQDADGDALVDAGTAAGHQVALVEGENVVKVKVTAGDGMATQTYTVTVTRSAVDAPDAPTGFSATKGNRYVTLAWDAPASGANITHHEYHYKTDGSYPDDWKTIPYSATGGFNEDGFTVTKLANDTAHTFELRAVNAGGGSTAVESSAVTPSGSGRIVESITMRRYDGQDGHPYGVGDEMVFVVKFSQKVACADATSLKVRFNLGSATKEASSYAGAGTDTWWYRYTVQEDDVDSDGIEIPAGSQALPDRYYSDNGCNNVFDETGIKAQGPLPDRKVDGVYPSLDSAAVNGAELVLTWDETLRDDRLPVAGDFAVTVTGSSRDVSSVAVAGSAVTLTLASAVERETESIFVSYTPGSTASDRLKDLASNDAPAVSNRQVTNKTPDTTPPVITSARVTASGTLVSLEFGEDVFGTESPAEELKDAFSVTVNSAARTITSIGNVGRRRVTLGVDPVIYKGHTVTVSYDQSAAGANALDDDAGNKVVSFEDFAVTNGSTQEVGLTNFSAAPGDGQVVLSWDAPDSGSGVTRHEYRQKEGTGSYPANFTQIPNSGEGGANEAGYTVTGLTNETVYTFELRSVVGTTEGTASESDPVTPTPGICDRTQIVYENIVDNLSDRDNCAEVNVADLESFTGSLEMPNESIASLKSGDFAGLTGLETLQLNGNIFTTLPANVFSGLTALENLDLNDGALSSLDARAFSGLTKLENLKLHDNDLSSLPGTVFSGPSALTTLTLNDNDLTMLPAGVFSGLSALEVLNLKDNDLNSLPAGVFSGLTALTGLVLDNNPNTGDTLALTVTVEKSGTDQARAKVLAGAPLAVEFTATVVNGSLPTGVTKLAVAKGSVDGTPVTVTRTTGTVAAVTVDIDLTTQPSLASGFTGFTFAKAASGLPATILPDTRSPQNFTAKPGDGQAVLSWDAPASGSGVTRHDYRYKSGTGSYPATWMDIPNSAEGGTNEDGYTVPNLTNETVYTFELRSVVGTTEGAASESDPVTPTPGICDRTQQVQDAIVTAVSGVTECAAVTVANLAGIGYLGFTDKGITSLKAGDFTGLTALDTLTVNKNPSLTGLPSGVFADLTAILEISLRENGLQSLPEDVFSGLTTVVAINLRENDLTSLPAGLFSGLTSLSEIYLEVNDLTSLPAGLFSGLTKLRRLDLGDNPNTGDTLLLTVTVEKVGMDQVRAKVPTGAPFAVAIPVTPANGTLAGGVTVLTVAAGSVESAAVTVTRTEGTTAAVTVDVDLSTQPTLPTGHAGYVFARAASGLPAEILPEEASLEPPTALRATPGDREAVLAWTPPASDSGFTRHQYRYRTDRDFGDWTDIPDSGPGEANGSRYTVTGLDNAVEYSFELRARDARAGKSDPATVEVTPTGPPRIVGVAVTSGPGLDDEITYGVGEEIRISVTFDQPVEVSGDPELALDVGGERLAEYHSGGGSETLVFVYVVTESDRDADGVSVGDDALRLDGNDRIGNGAGDDAELAHDGPGAQPGHMVDGARRAGVHTHAAFTHSHSHFRERYPEHMHDGHEHPNKANNHSSGMRPGEHVHHEQARPHPAVFLGPDLRRHDNVEHTHLCYDLKPSCNQGDAYAERGDELGLPIEVTHSHAGDAEPEHGFDWRTWFEEGGSGAAVRVADAEAARGEDATLDFEVSLEPAQAFAVRVDYETRDGTATAGADYRETRGTLEFAPGETRTTVSVRILGDAAGDETLTLALGDATAATVADGEATGTIRAGEPASPPAIARVAVTSTPGLDGNTVYGGGEEIRITVTFDQPVWVEGDPEFGLSVGGPSEAEYASGSGTERLVFVYLVLEVDIDRDGIWIGDHDHPDNPTFRLDGEDRIRNAAGEDADLSHRSLGRQRGHKVDGTRSGATEPHVGSTHSHPEFTHSHARSRERYDEHRHASHEHDNTADEHPSGMRPGQHVHHEQERPHPAVFLGPDLRGHGGVEHTHLCYDIKPSCNAGDNYAEHGDDLGLPIEVSHSHGEDSEPGHGFGWQTWFENWESGERLMGRFASMPARHDGSKRIGVRVRFNAPVDASEEEMAGHGVQVRGGRVHSAGRVPAAGDGEGPGTRAAKSTRGTKSMSPRPGSEESGEVVWQIEIEPDGDGDVTVSIEAGRPCDEEGAICTADGRSLSEGISTTVEGPETGPAPLTASFKGMPEAHDGESAFTFRVAFSEDIGISYRSLREDAFTVTGGRVTGGERVDDRRDLFEMTVEPDGGGEVTVTLPAGRECPVSGAICTKGENRRQLTNTPAATVAGPAAAAPAVEPLTASFEGMPGEHDGAGAFTFRVAFSENIGISNRSLREDAFAVTGGRVTRGRRVDRRRDLFEVTVRPDSAGGVTIALPAGRECAVPGAICTRGEPRRQLTNTLSATVAGPAVESGAAGLTARFARVPSEHDGTTAFKLKIAFSEEIRMSGRRLRSDVVAVSGGRATKAGRANKRKDLWKLKVRPDSLADVTVTLAAGAACDTPGAVCTADGRALSNTISTVVRGPVAVSVADARVREASDATLDFAVSLSRAASGRVSVTYATADGTATAGSDYTRASGKLRFAPGETEKRVRVPVLDDVVDEGEETFTLRLLNASGAVVADGEATGTIVNSDPLQKMWLSRFGRTVAGQVVDAVTGRLSGPTGGSQVTLGGRSIDLSAQSGGTGDARRTLAGALGAARAANDDEPLAGPGLLEAARSGLWEVPETGGTARTLTGRELLLGSSFHLAAGGGEAGGPGYAAWGRVTVGGFDAEAPADGGTVRLDGEVTTGILGADAQWERWLAGVALSVSEGEGTFDQPGVDSGTVESSLSSINPYVRYQASDRLSVWGLLSYGTGDMTMTQAANDNRGEIVTRTDLMMRLGAAGARGVLLEADESGGIDLALRGDAFLVQMESEAAANTVETKADASRLRLVLEAGRSFALDEGAVLAPALELGLRHDGGDAETGTGVEVGGRIRYADAGSGLTVEANARTLVAHEDSGYREWGAGGSVRLGPDASGRGLSLALAPVWGTPSSGVDRLWSARDAAGLAPGGEFEAERRLEAELGYGLGAFGGHGVVTPYAGLGLAEAGDRTWRAGARWSLAPHLAMSLDATRREPANDDGPEHGVQFRLNVRW